MSQEIKIIEAESKEEVAKQMQRLANSFKIVDYTLATSTRYSKFRDEEYTIYSVLVRYECPEAYENLL